ncbi:MAG: cytochrome P450 [Gemmatimonadota bacterium]|nr:cytochrome P450 [Gemmatimonadota bacterium]
MSEIESLTVLARLDDPAFYANDPHAVFKRLRREAPVFWIEPTGFWAVTSYEAVHTAFTDPERFSSLGDQQLVAWTQDREHFMRFSEDAEFPPPTARNLITSDAPFHTVFRKMVMKTGQFGAKAVPAIEERLSPFVDDLGRNLAAGATGEADEIVSAPLAAATIACFLGLPLEFAGSLRRWSEAIEPPGSGDTPQRMQAGAEAASEMWTVLRDLLDADSHHGTLCLLRDQQKLTDEVDTDDLLELVCDLVVAGVESTRNMVTSGLVAFAQHPDEWTRIQSGEVSVDNAVEEILRWEPPAPTIGRVATEDTTLAGQPINAGDRLLLMYASANRDESVWTDPDRFDVTRSSKVPNLAFGRGAHLCVGASFSRMSMRMIIETLLSNNVRFNLTAPPKRAPGVNATAQYATAPMSFERDNSAQHN